MIDLACERNLERYISTGENFDILEQSTDRAIQNWQSIRAVKPKLDFGPFITSQNFREPFDEVEQDVNSFLDFHRATEFGIAVFHPKYLVRAALKAGLVLGGGVGLATGFSQPELALEVGLLSGAGGVLVVWRDYNQTRYDDKNQTLVIGMQKKAGSVASMAHEYTHLIQHMTMEFIAGPIVEGHATGVDRYISELFAQRYDNLAYLYKASQINRWLLPDAYKRACRLKKTTPKNSLADIGMQLISDFSGRSRYVLGLAVMTIAEQRHGYRIYRDVINNDLSFLAA